MLKQMSTDGAAASPNGAQATSGCTGAAVTKSFHATSVCKDIASAVEMAVLMPALSAAASGTPHCPYVVAIAAANVKLALHACSHEQEDSMTVVDEQLLQQQPQNNAQRFSSSFAPGSSVGGPCLEPCEQPVDALYETRWGDTMSVQYIIYCIQIKTAAHAPFGLRELVISTPFFQARWSGTVLRCCMWPVDRFVWCMWLF